VIIAVVAQGRLVRVVVVIVVNAGVVVGVGISADVTDVVVPSCPRVGVAGPYSAGFEASCEWEPVSPRGMHAWANVTCAGVEGEGPRLPL
jgi:hypothetical protein